MEIFLSIAEIIFAYAVIIGISSHSTEIQYLFGNETFLRYLLMSAVVLLKLVFPVAFSKEHKFSLEELGIRKGDAKKQLRIGIAILALMLAGFVLLPHALGLNWLQVCGTPVHGKRLFLYYSFHYIFIVGFTEEFIFRGYFYALLQRTFHNDKVAIFGTALLFAGYHLYSRTYLLLVIETFITGILLAYYTHKMKGGSLIGAALIHGLYDASLMWIVTILI